MLQKKNAVFWFKLSPNKFNTHKSHFYLQLNVSKNVTKLTIENLTDLRWKKNQTDLSVSWQLKKWIHCVVQNKMWWKNGIQSEMRNT